MQINKIPARIIFLVGLVIVCVLIPSGILANDLECQKAVQSFSPDSFEYHPISEEEAFELHVSEDEYEPSTIGEYTLLEEDVLPQVGSIVLFCNEADCDSVTVNFGDVTHPAYLSCYGNVLFYNIPAGTYSWSASGCGRISTGYLNVDGSRGYTIRICPSPTQACCSSGCVNHSSYGCWQCLTRPLARPSLTTTITTTTPPLTTTTQPISSKYSISGYVTGLVISGITIQLKGADSKTVTTDETGYYELSNLETGYYTITPQAKDCIFEPQNYVVQNLTGDLPYMDFAATQKIQSLPCPLEIIYGDTSEEIKLLRYFRDKILDKTQEGREYIRLYYQWSPLIVKAMKEDKEFTKNIKEIFDEVLILVDEEK